MPKIETRENKRLKLVNVISKEVRLQEFVVDQNRHLMMLENYIKVNKFTTLGPLIMYNGAMIGVNDGGVPIMTSKIMIQIKEENIKVEEPYFFYEEIMELNCLMARFIGKQDYIEYATNKLSVVAYEEEIELTGETYMIFVNQSEEESMIDIFMPVKED